MRSENSSLLAITAAIALSLSSAEARPPPPCPEIKPVSDAGAASAQLQDQTAFAAPALTLAKSAQAAHLKLLGKTLNNPAALSGRFDGDLQAIRCELLPVLRTLAGNPCPEARRQYLRLLTARPFINKADRIDALIRSSAMFRPAPRVLVRFWRRYSRPRDGFVNHTAKALADNGSRPAVQLFASLLKDKGRSLGGRRYWIRWHVLENRHGLEMLMTCRQLLLRGSGLPARLRLALIEALFDYRPEKWCRPDRCMTPPPRQEMPADAQKELRRIAALALKMMPGERLQRVIRETLVQLDRLDQQDSGPSKTLKQR